MMTPSGIYRIFCTANGKSYIGSSTEIARRFRNHKNNLAHGTHPNPHLQNAWNKHGESAFEFKILEMCEESVLRQREKEIMDRVRPEFNLMGVDPNQSLASHSPETRAKMRAASLGRPRISEETRAKMSEAHKRRPRYSCSPEARVRMSEAHKGKPGHPCSPETRAKMRAIHLGHPYSPENRAKMLAAIIGRPCSPETRAKIRSANLGRHHSEEELAKMRAAQKKRYKK